MKQEKTQKWYLSIPIDGRGNGRLSWLMRRLNVLDPTFGLKCKHGRHMTIAFAEEMPVTEIEAIKKETLTLKVPENSLEYNDLDILGPAGKKVVAVVASEVSPEWLEYVQKVKDIMKNHGCKISHEDDFLAHVSLMAVKNEEDLKLQLDNIKKEMKPVCFKYKAPIWRRFKK